MDDHDLSLALSEWLRDTDRPLPGAADDVRAATARSERTRQRGWAPRASGVPGQERRRVDRIPLRTAVALVLIAVLATALASGLLLTDAFDAPAPATTAVSTEEGLHVQTERIDLRADALRLAIDEEVFTTAGAPLDVQQTSSERGQPVLRLDWTERGQDFRLEVVVAAEADPGPDGSDDWYVDTIRLQRPGSEERWASYQGPLFKTPYGEVYENDVELELFGADEQMTLALDGLELRVERAPELAWWQDAHIAGIPIPDFIGRLLPSDWAPGPEPTPGQQTAARPRVVVSFAGVDLHGVLRPDGSVRVDRYRGRNTKDLVDVAVGAGDSVWVARPTSVYRIGGSRVVNTKTPGLDQIRWIEPNDDGSLDVHGDGVWRLEGETWTKLSEDVVAKPDAEMPESMPGTRSDFIYGGMTSDGTFWGRTDKPRSRLLTIPAGDLSVLPSPVDDLIGSGSPTVFSAAGLDLVGEDLGQGVMHVTDDGSGFELSGLLGLGVADGTLWVADGRGVHALGRPDLDPASGPEWIDSMWPVGGERLRVEGDGTWLLQDGSWRDLGAPIRGRPMDPYDPLVMNDGTIVGIPDETAPPDHIARFVDGRWERQPVPVGVRFHAGLDALWVEHEAGDEGVPGTWAQLVDGEWVPLVSDARVLGGSPEAVIARSMAMPDGSLWFTVGSNDDPLERYVRYQHGRWSSYSLEELEAAVGVSLRPELPSVRSDGSTYLEPATYRSGLSMVLLDEDHVMTVPLLPPGMFVRDITDDGSVWAIGGGGDLLVMPRAATVTKLERIITSGPT